jgi:uncharacterized protein (TIGR03083 family)
MDATEAYHQTRLRMTELIRGVDDPAVAGRPVPTCPEWTVSDLAAHVTGVATDIMAGRLDGVGTDPWTAAQVERGRGRSLAELMDEWDEAGAALEAAFAGGNAPDQLVFDTVTHEHDLRTALDRPGARDDAAVGVALRFVRDTWPLATAHLDVPPLRIRSRDTELVVGDDPDTTLELSAFEALRALTGRRSEAQIRALPWPAGDDATRWLPAFTWGPFTLATTDVPE